MPLLPNNWNVVIVGHWNRAILSPAGIAKRLFGLPSGTPVQVLVPLDVVAPYHVRHENITVVPGGDRLIVAPVHNTFDNLIEATAVIRRALKDLPETPVFAGGLNLSYKSDTEVVALRQVTASQWDDRLSDKNFVIASRSVVRSVKWRDATINVAITAELTGASSVTFNFDYKSQSSDAIRKWLDLKANEIEEQVDAILFETLGLSREEIGHV